jgi:2-acylglycerol O-acyltransferase 2
MISFLAKELSLKFVAQIRCSHEYFNIKTIYENETAIAKHPTVLFLLEPHGVLPLSICGFIGLKYQPNLIGAISSACFAIPLMRHFYTWAGAESIDRKNLERNLSNGTSVVMCPGGVQETALVDTIPNTLRLYLKQRKGCIRLAMRQGVTIVPCFAFGTQNSFTLLGTSDQPWLKRLGRWLGALPMIVLGSFYLPLAPPPPADYVNVIGTPIEVGPAHTDQMMVHIFLLYSSEGFVTI